MTAYLSPQEIEAAVIAHAQGLPRLVHPFDDAALMEGDLGEVRTHIVQCKLHAALAASAAARIAKCKMKDAVFTIRGPFL